MSTEQTEKAGLAYRLITGPDDAAFCQRISNLLAQGYVLYGSPSITYDSERKTVIAAQAVIRSDV